MRGWCGVAALSLAAAGAAGQTYTIATFAGGGFPENTPATVPAIGAVPAVAVDGGGNVFVALPSYHLVAKLDRRSGLLTRVAGNGGSGYSGDGGPATSAQLNYPAGIAVDSAGAIYIADRDACVVRKVAHGVITTVAGTGTGGFSGDGGPVKSAQLDGPTGVAVDADFHLYIADGRSHRVREVANGIIDTVAGDGVQGPGTDGPATGVHLSADGVAVDGAGNLYIADSFNGRVWKLAGGVVTTVAGSGSAYPGDGPAPGARLAGPVSVAVDASGDLVVADRGQVRVVSNGTISTVAGNGSPGFSGDGGPALLALVNPSGLAAGADGAVYIADSTNQRVRQVAAGVITTIAGGGFSIYTGDGNAAGYAQLGGPSGVAVDTGGMCT